MTLARTSKDLNEFMFQHYPWKGISVNIHNDERLQGFAKFMRFTKNMQELEELWFYFTFGDDMCDEDRVYFPPRVIPSVRFVSLAVNGDNVFHRDISHLLVDMQMALPNVKEFELWEGGTMVTHKGAISPYPWNLERLKFEVGEREDSSVLLRSILGTSDNLQCLGLLDCTDTNVALSRFRHSVREFHMIEMASGEIGIVNESFVSLRKLVFDGETFKTEDAINFPDSLSSLVLTVYSSYFSENVLFPNITYLELELSFYQALNRNWEIVVAGISKTFPNLIELLIMPGDGEVCQMKDKWLLPLGPLQRLKRLSLAGFDTFTGGFLCEGQFPMLEEVKFRKCDDVMPGLLRLVKPAKVSLSQGSIFVFPNRHNNYEYNVI